MPYSTGGYYFTYTKKTFSLHSDTSVYNGEDAVSVILRLTDGTNVLYEKDVTADAKDGKVIEFTYEDKRSVLEDGHIGVAVSVTNKDGYTVTFQNRFGEDEEPDFPGCVVVDPHGTTVYQE